MCECVFVCLLFVCMAHNLNEGWEIAWLYVLPNNNKQNYVLRLGRTKSIFTGLNRNDARTKVHE